LVRSEGLGASWIMRVGADAVTAILKSVHVGPRQWMAAGEARVGGGCKQTCQEDLGEDRGKHYHQLMFGKCM